MMPRRLIAALLFVSVTAGAAELVAPDALARQIEAGAAPAILDVRTPEEYAAGHLPGARLLPHDRIRGSLEGLADLKDKPLVVYCRSGKRAAMAAETLEAAGFSDVRILEDSLEGWTRAGGQVAR